jgi:hypothetical protein
VTQALIQHFIAKEERFRSFLFNVSFAGLIVSMVILLGIPLSVEALPRADGPELAMEISSRDFGDVFDGEELEQNFPVRNVGTSTLEFSQKSTLSRAETNSSLKITAAVWHPTSEYATRPVTAMRAAPT